MEIIKKGDYKEPNWSLEVMCTANGWSNHNKPCYSTLKLNSKDIYRRSYHRYGEGKKHSYGFICPVCHCFTEIDKKKIPENIKQNCLNVAKEGSDEWRNLTEAEKEISKVL